MTDGSAEGERDERDEYDRAAEDFWRVVREYDRRILRRLLLACLLMAAVLLALATAVGGATAHAEDAPAGAGGAVFTAADTYAAIDEASAETGVSAGYLRAVEGCETGWTFSPDAVGDGGTSFGVAQIHRGGGEWPRFFAAGWSDVFNPYQATRFLADEINAGRAAAWSCAR